MYVRGYLQGSENGRVVTIVSTSGTRRVNLVTNPVDKSWMRKGKWLLQLNQEEPLCQ
jgi:hypothetical protein